MKISAKIKKLNYDPTLCRELKEYDFEDLENAIGSSTFLLNLPNKNQIAMSRWVSPKRTRSYPYARVYDTLDYRPRMTIIPIFKDEGIDGDRDFLQYDTVAMMSLLNVDVIIAYYSQAEKSFKQPGKQKITRQEFDINYLKKKINEKNRFQSDTLHWNLAQLEEVGGIGEMAIQAYRRISEGVGVPMHSFDAAKRRIEKIRKGTEVFKELSRLNAIRAANRETLTNHLAESTTGEKPTITITNFVGGEYHLTVDEVHIDREKKIIDLVEAKNTTNHKKLLTSTNDIKDAIFKMIIFTNLEEVRVNGENYNHRSVVKLTSPNEFEYGKLGNKQKEIYDNLVIEAKTNKFSIMHE